jgi:periplasmic protein CpxP/Spy
LAGKRHGDNDGKGPLYRRLSANPIWIKVAFPHVGQRASECGRDAPAGCKPGPGTGCGDDAKEEDDVKSMSGRMAHAAAGAASILLFLSVSTALLTVGASNARAGGSPPGLELAQAAAAPAAAAPAAPAPSAPAPSAPAPAAPSGGSFMRGLGSQSSASAHVEIRIAELHDQLHIAPAQEAQFKAYADVMRSNAQAMEALFQERAQSPDTTAIGELRWYTRLTTAHGEALTKLVSVFDALYQSMSDQQKKAADKVFGKIQQRRLPRQAQ